MSDIIVLNHNPHVLLKTIASVLNATQTDCWKTPPEMCNILLHFLMDKVVTTGPLISAPAFEPSGSVPCLAVFDMFEPLSLLFLEDVVCHIKPGSTRYVFHLQVPFSFKILGEGSCSSWVLRFYIAQSQLCLGSSITSNTTGQ